jgi:hypothetical protein
MMKAGLGILSYHDRPMPGVPEAAAAQGSALSGVLDHVPDVAALPHVGVSLVDLVKAVGLGDQLVQLELTG